MPVHPYIQALFDDLGISPPGGQAIQVPERAPGQPAPVQPLGPEEQAGLLSRIGSGALHGVSYMGASLGKAFGGRAIRGLLGGHPDELASVIPFSDALDITNPEREVHGSDLLGGDHSTSFLSPTGLGGAALEAALDPGTYLTFGGSALSKLGTAAKAAGVLPAATRARTLGLAAGSSEAAQLAAHLGVDAAEVAGKPLGYAVGLGLPFSHEAVAGVGPGFFAAKDALGNFLGNVGGKVAEKVPLAGRLGNAVAGAADSARLGVNRLFDPAVRDMATATGQQFGRQASAAMDTGIPQARREMLGLLDAVGGPAKAQESGQALRAAVEGGDLSQPGAAQAKTLLDRMRDAEKGLGVPLESMSSQHGTGYFPRQQTLLPQETAGFPGGRAALPAGHASVAAREAILDLPGGTEAVNRLAKDPQLKGMVGTVGPQGAGSAPNPLGPAEHVRHNYLGGSAAEDGDRAALAQLVNSGKATPEEQALYTSLKGKYDQSLALADWAKGLDPQYAEKGLDFFANHPLSDFLARNVAHQRTVASVTAMHDMLSASAKTAAEAEPGSVSLFDALRNAGLSKEGQVTEGAIAQQGQRLGHGQDLRQLFVPKGIADDAARYLQTVQAPGGLEPFLKAFDSLTTLTKAFQTSPWPGFHARNTMTGAFMNWVTGHFSAQAYKDAWAVHRGGVIADANKIKGFENLSPEEATKAIAELGFAHGLTGNRGNIFHDTLGQGEHAAQQGLPFVPGPGQVQPNPVTQYLGGIGETLAAPLQALRGDQAARAKLNPFGVQGVGGRNVDTMPLVKAGKELGSASDEINRMSGFIDRLRQGMAPDVAALEAKATHYDYTKLTTFERSVMRRAIPFYNWMRHNTPFVANELATRPGGRMAMSVKLAAQAKGQDPGFVPAHLGSGLAARVGQEEDGSQRFLSRTGLPFEDVAEIASPMGLLGSLNPILKAPLELASGRQFFSGRNLADLQGVAGNTLADQVLFNSPAGRAIGAVRTLADERKGPGAKALNLLSGVHLTDVDMNAARDKALRDFVSQGLSGTPDVHRYERFFTRPGDLLTPEELLLLRAQASREQAARRAPARRP